MTDERPDDAIIGAPPLEDTYYIVALSRLSHSGDMTRYPMCISVG